MIVYRSQPPAVFCGIAPKLTSVLASLPFFIFYSLSLKPAGRTYCTFVISKRKSPPPVMFPSPTHLDPPSYISRFGLPEYFT